MRILRTLSPEISRNFSCKKCLYFNTISGKLVKNCILLNKRKLKLKNVYVPKTKTGQNPERVQNHG